MKRILSLIMICCFLASFSGVHAQTTPASATDADKAKKKADKDAAKAQAKADKAKAEKTTTAPKTTTASPTKKDGTADMRYKSNKDAAKTAPAAATKTAPVAAPVAAPAAAAKTAPVAAPATTTAAKPTPATAKPAVVNPVNKSADKVVGTDAKGRTIYEGAKGGRYTLTAAGNKEYIKH